MSPELHWLLLEGLLPLLGANVAYVLLAGAFINARNPTAAPGSPGSFKFSWEPASDAMGWLYGSCLLAIQLGSAAISSKPLAGVGFFVLAFLCSFQLMAGLYYRGSDQNWKPPRNLNYTAMAVVAVVLVAGYFSKRGVGDDGHKGGDQPGISSSSSGPRAGVSSISSTEPSTGTSSDSKRPAARSP